MAFMDGSLYAGIGDYYDPNEASTCNAVVARLDVPTGQPSSNGTWYPDGPGTGLGAGGTNNPQAPGAGEPNDTGAFLNVMQNAGSNPGTACNNGQNSFMFQAVDSMGVVNFTQDMNGKPISSTNVLVTGFWDWGTNGIWVGQMSDNGTGTATHTWYKTNLYSGAGSTEEVRSVYSYTDSSPNQMQIAFAGSDFTHGIFSGMYNSSTNQINWNTTPESGSASNQPCGSAANVCRVMAFAQCGTPTHLYATMFDQVWMRTDDTTGGPNNNGDGRGTWSVVYRGSDLVGKGTESSGWRGLTCVKSTFPGDTQDMLIAAFEGAGQVYAFQLGSASNNYAIQQTKVELYANQWLSSQLGLVTYSVLAFNDMPLTGYGVTGCYDRYIGLGDLAVEANSYPTPLYVSGSYHYPYAGYTVRHCDGTYDNFIQIHNLNDTNTLVATRTMIPSQFPGDPAGTVFAGGFDTMNGAFANTNWLYRGTAQQ